MVESLHYEKTYSFPAKSTARITPKAKLKLLVLEADAETLDKIIDAIRIVCADSTIPQ